MNTEIKGKLEVTRSLEVAADINVHDNATVEGDLKVRGWLDAKNIKTPCKGLFADVDRLNESYPTPLPGWWALVGDSIPTLVYRSENGIWVSTGETGGSTVVDLDHYNNAVQAINSDIADIQDDIEGITDTVANIEHPLSSVATDNADLSISDQQGHEIVSFTNGHIRTKHFDSATDLEKAVEAAAGDADFSISDAQGNDIMRIDGGHIITKHFDSAALLQNNADKVDSSYSKSDFAIGDETGNDILRIEDGHIKTKHFDSSSITDAPDSIIALNRDSVEAEVMPVICACDVSLLCFGDIHGDSDNFNRLKLWCERYNTMLSDTLCLGDINNVNANEYLGWYNDQSILNVIGNHDIYSTNGNLNETACYNRYMGGIGTWSAEYQVNKCYYYKDYGRVILIVLDCMHWSTAQATWLGTTLDAARAGGKAVVIATHWPVGAWTGIDCAFNSKDNFTTHYDSISAPALVQHFIETGGTFVCYLCGHTHNDVVGRLTSYSDQLMITFDSATLRPENNDLRQRGTKSQDCFTIVGVDLDRRQLMLYRVGNSTDRYLRSKRTLTLDFID